MKGRKGRGGVEGREGTTTTREKKWGRKGQKPKGSLEERAKGERRKEDMGKALGVRSTKIEKGEKPEGEDGGAADRKEKGKKKGRNLVLSRGFEKSTKLTDEGEKKVSGGKRVKTRQGSDRGENAKKGYRERIRCGREEGFVWTQRGGVRRPHPDKTQNWGKEKKASGLEFEDSEKMCRGNHSARGRVRSKTRRH